MQYGGVDFNVVVFNVRQYWYQWYFNMLEDIQWVFMLLQFWLYFQMQLECNVGIFCCVVISFFQCNLVKGELIFIFVSDFFEGNGFMFQLVVGKIVYIVVVCYVVENVRFEYGIECNFVQFNVVIS